MFALDTGRVHLCCGPGWEDYVHLRNSVGPFGTVSGLLFITVHPILLSRDAS